MKRASTHLFKRQAIIALFSNFYFDFRPPGQTPGQDRGAKIRHQGQLECATPRGSPGGGEWSGLELTDALAETLFWTGARGRPPVT